MATPRLQAALSPAIHRSGTARPGMRAGRPGCDFGRADDAADRRRSIAQRRRSPYHLDLIGRQWIDRHEVVFAEIGRASTGYAIFKDADAIDVETPDDRPARCARC